MARTEREKNLDAAERAVNAAFATGKADRAQITRMAQLDAAEAVARAGEAMEADEEADEAMRLAVITERSKDREKIKAARSREYEARKKANGLHRDATRSAKQAYDAIKFSAPNKMGFMRAVQAIFAIHIFTSLVFLLLTNRDHFTYNVGSIMDWVMIILEGMAFWMFINRYKVARPFVIGMSALGIVVPAVADMIAGTFHISTVLVNGAFYIFLILYFVFSKRVKATLVNDVALHTGAYEKDEFEIKRSGWPFVRNLGIYFVVFSILGHWMEMAMCQLIIAGVVEGEYDPTNTMLWRDWLYPFPMEGMAVVLIALLLYPLYTWLRKKFEGKIAVAYVLSFLANALACSIIEFSMGMIYNSHYELWNYSDMPFNFMGQVCLQNAAAFGVACSVIAWFVYPMLERWIARVPRAIMNIVFVGVMIFGGIVFGLYIVNPPEAVVEIQEEVAQITEQTEAEAEDEVVSEVEQQINVSSGDIAGALSAEDVINQQTLDAVRSSSNLTEEEKAELTQRLEGVSAELRDMQNRLQDAA